MPKIVIVGAGSGFGGRLSIDILSRPALRGCTLALCDIHAGRLAGIKSFVESAIERHKLECTLLTSTDRREVLADADFVVTSISAGGGAYHGWPFTSEINIPRKYGVDQFVGDTVSVGAVFRFLRTAPVHLQILQDCEELCPNALVLNHTNPMCMLTWMHHAATSMTNVGLCHGVQGTSKKLAAWLGVPFEEVAYQWAGINHMTWLLEYKRGNEDLYPRIKALLDDPEKIKGERVRFQILKHFGYFCTESNRHDSEYLPYFRKHSGLFEQFDLETRPVSDQPDEKRKWAWLEDSGGEDALEKMIEGLKTSHEFTSGIMEAAITDRPYRFYGNVMNTGLIPNLPEGCCVELPCMVDSHGVKPSYIGPLPEQLAALNRTNVSVQELAVKAFMERDKEAAFHACALDPLTAAVLTLDQIRSMFDELWEAEGFLLDYFKPSFTGRVKETCAP